MDYSPIWISMKTVAVSIVITFALGLLAARMVVGLRSERLRNVIDAVLTLPLVLPPTVAGFFLLFIFGTKRPVGRFLLEVMGVKIVFSWAATVLAAVVISFPLMYRSARASLEQVDSTLIFSARTIGMGEWEIFWHVMLPLAAPGVAAGGVLSFARGLGEFGATAMIAGNIAGKTRTLPLAVYSAVAGGHMELAYGYVAILLVISFLGVLSMNYFTSRERRMAKNRKKSARGVRGQGANTPDAGKGGAA